MSSGLRLGAVALGSSLALSVIFPVAGVSLLLGDTHAQEAAASSRAHLAD